MRHWVALLTVASTSLGAQSIEASASTLRVQSHTFYGASRIEQSGTWFAGDAAVRLSRLRVGLSAAMGSLAGNADSIQPDRTGRLTTVTAHFTATDWLSVGAIAEARRFDTDVGPSVWRLMGANVRMTPSLGAELVQGIADISYWPSAQILNGPAMSLAFRAVLGAGYRLGKGVSANVAYRFERFDFDAATAGTARLDQFRGATIGLTLHALPLFGSSTPR